MVALSKAEISFRKQNLMALLCSIKSGIVKIEKCTLGPLVNRLLIMSQKNAYKWYKDFKEDREHDIDMKFGPYVVNSAAAHEKNN